MRSDEEARRGRPDTSAYANGWSYDEPIDPMDAGLPANLDAERFVLGSVLLDGSRFSEVATLVPDDFSVERHRRVFRRMQEIHARREAIDRVTVAEELRRHNEIGSDGLGFLVSLDDGMPFVPHLDSYVRIVRLKSAARRAILMSRRVADDCILDPNSLDEILSSHLNEIAGVRALICLDDRKIRRIEDLESIFAKRASLEYLVKPELPEKAIVCLTGNSESGKTTLACAWARDVSRQGHAVLILDRDKNPRDRICERLERLGVEKDGELFHVWDCEQNEEPPQPDDPIVADWVKRMIQTTGKSPLIIVDSLVSFFTGEEDENSAVDMRALFDRCRALTKLGATVIIIHHTNRNGEARGSSDFKPASDQAFLVSNCDRAGGRLLDIIGLQCEKSRYGLSGRIEYQYAGGKVLRTKGDDVPAGKTVNEQLVELLKANPGILKEAFVSLAIKHGHGRRRGRNFIEDGKRNGKIRLKKEGRKQHHFWHDDGSPEDRPDAQGDLY